VTDPPPVTDPALPTDPPPAPAAFLDACADVLAAAVARGPILDLACGRGRNTLACVERGWPVVGLDRSRERLAELRAASGRRAHAVCADLEVGAAIPFASGAFGAVLVFRYLHRPLVDAIADLVAPGGVLVYETFTVAQRALGTGPQRDAFLLQPGELPGLFRGLEVLVSEEGRSADPRPSETARLLARRPG